MPWAMPTKLADTILSQRDPEMLDEWMIELEEKEISFYSYFHPSYPYLLKQIYDPPLGIYVKGVLPDDHIDKIGVIGARRCSQYAHLWLTALQKIWVRPM